MFMLSELMESRQSFTETDEQLEIILNTYLSGGIKDKVDYPTIYDKEIAKLTCDIHWYQSILKKKKGGNHKSIRLSLNNTIVKLYKKRRTLIIKRNDSKPMIEPLTEELLNSHQYYQSLLSASFKQTTKAEILRDIKRTMEEIEFIKSDIENWFKNSKIIIEKLYTYDKTPGSMNFFYHQKITTLYDQEQLFKLANVNGGQVLPDIKTLKKQWSEIISYFEPSDLIAV